MSYRHIAPVAWRGVAWRGVARPGLALPLPTPPAASFSSAFWDLKLDQVNSFSLFISVFLLSPQDVFLGHETQRRGSLVSWSSRFLHHIHSSENTVVCPVLPFPSLVSFSSLMDDGAAICLYIISPSVLYTLFS